jgi:hypothetical protein
MHLTRLAALAFGGVVGSLVIPACSLDVPDLNNPGLDELETHPTSVSIGAACTGLLIGNRGNLAAENGYVVELGILGREAYNFDSADPRYVGELLQGKLSAASTFGGNFWAFPYANLRLGNIILHAVDTIDEVADKDRGVPNGLTRKDKAAVRGFTNTIGALDLLQVIVTHDENGAVIDLTFDLSKPLPPIVSREATYQKIVSLLDGALPDLDAADETFPFPLSDGFAGFDTPATFRTFNRAIRARVAIYMKDYAAALTALAMSFIDDAGDGGMPNFNRGVYYTYTTRTGDQTSALINPNIYAHPSLATDAMMNGATIDNRYTDKVTTAKKPGSVGNLSSTLAFTKYASPSSPVPLIRNEELILIKAEALFYTNDVAGAVRELNVVRQKSGGLPAYSGLPNETTFVNELLYERRYSLLFEGGHRWIDLRRFGKALPLDNPDTDVANVRFPIPLPECNARPDLQGTNLCPNAT